MALFPEKVDMSMLKKKDGSPIATTVKTSSVAKDTLPKKIDMSMLSKKTATPVYEGNSDYQENMAMLEKMKANGYGSADEVSKGYTDYEKSKNTMDSVGTNAKAFGLGVSSGVANLGAVAPRAMVNIFGSSSKAAHNIIDNAERAEQRLGDYVNSIDGDYTGLKKEIAGGVGAVGASVPEMALDAGVMFATGGASLAGTSAKVGAKMTLKETAKQAAKEMVSPVNAVRLTRYFVNENDNALKDGASYGDAIKQALLYSVPAVIIEGSGGIDNVMKDVLKNGVSKNFQTSAMKLLQKTATSALEEGGEEVLQQIWERASQKATYDKDMKLVSNTERAIIEPANLARAGITGAVAGGLIGGGINGLNYAGSKLGKDTNVPAKNLVVEEGSAGEKPVNKVYGVLGDSVDNVVDNVPSEDINYITGVPVREEKMAAAKAEAKPALKNDYDEFYGYAGAPTSLDFVENGTTFGVNDTNNGVKTAKLVENSTNDLNNNANVVINDTNDSSFSSENVETPAEMVVDNSSFFAIPYSSKFELAELKDGGLNGVTSRVLNDADSYSSSYLGTADNGEIIMPSVPMRDVLTFENGNDKLDELKIYDNFYNIVKNSKKVDSNGVETLYTAYTDLAGKKYEVRLLVGEDNELLKTRVVGKDGYTSPTIDGELSHYDLDNIQPQDVLEFGADKLKAAKTFSRMNSSTVSKYFVSSLKGEGNKTFKSKDGLSVFLPADWFRNVLGNTNVSNRYVGVAAGLNIRDLITNGVGVGSADGVGLSSLFSLGGKRYDARFTLDEEGAVTDIEIVDAKDENFATGRNKVEEPVDVNKAMAASGAGKVLSEKEEHRKFMSSMDPANKLSFKDKTKRNARSLYTAFVNSQHSLDRMSNANDGPSVKSDISANVQLIRQSSGAVDCICSTGLVDMNGNIIGESFGSVFAGVKNDIEAYNRFTALKHHIARFGVDKPVLNLTLDEAKAELAELTKQKPRLENEHKKIQEWWNKFSDEWIVKSGLASAGLMDQWRTMYPDYRPTFRVASEELDGGFGTFEEENAVVATGKMQGAVGSTAELLRVDHAFFEQINKVVRTARKNELHNSMYDSVLADPKTNAPFARIEVSTEENAEAENYTSLTKDMDMYLDAIDKPDALNVLNSGYRLKMFKEGKMVELVVSKNIFDSLNMFNYNLPAFEGFVSKFATTPFKKLTTGLNPVFAVGNIVRDFGGYMMQSTGSNPVSVLSNYGKAIESIYYKTDRFKQFQSFGGFGSGHYRNESGFAPKISNHTNFGDLKLGEKFQTAIAIIGEYGEAVPRFAEYMNYLDVHGDTPSMRKQAAKAAADVTTNFSRFGADTKRFDALVPYLNATVQSFDKTARFIKDNPKQFAVRGGAILILPTIVLYAINHDNPYYEDIDDRRKDRNYLIPNMLDCDENGYAKSFIEVPMARPYGVLLGATIERVFRAVEGDKDAFDGLETSLTTEFLPPNIFKDNIFKAFFDLSNNKDFAGRDIVPASLVDLPPEYQYTSSTSRLGMAGCKITNGLLSPIQVDYLLNSFTGWIGDEVLAATSLKNNSISDVVMSAGWEPIKKAVFADSTYSHNLDEKFYENYNKAITDSSVANLELPAYYNKAVLPVERVKNYYSTLSTTASSMYKDERAMLGDKSLNYFDKTKAGELNREKLRELYDVDHDALVDAQAKLETVSSDAMNRLENNIAFGNGSDNMKAKATEYMYDLVYGEYIAGGGMELSSATTATKLYEDWQASGLNMSDYAALSATCIDHGLTRDTVGSVVDAKGEGIGVSTYLKYKKDTVGWKKAEVMAYVSKLNLTWQQKDYLLYSRGYAPTVK